MVPATAGFLTAFVLFGIAMMYFVAPSKLHADNDVPLVMVNSGPELAAEFVRDDDEYDRRRLAGD